MSASLFFAVALVIGLPFFVLFAGGSGPGQHAVKLRAQQLVKRIEERRR